MSQPAATQQRTDQPGPTLLSFLEVEDHRNVLSRSLLDARDLSKLMGVSRATRDWSKERLGVGELVRRIAEIDVLAGIYVPFLRHLTDPEFALEGGAIRLVAR